MFLQIPIKILNKNKFELQRFYELTKLQSLKKKVYNQNTQTKTRVFVQETIHKNLLQMFEDLPPNTYLVLLVFMEIAMLIFSLLGQFNSGVYFIAVRIIFLIMAQCCKQPRSAAFYSVLALMNAFYAFDPVGLFITGHGQKRSFPANIFCIVAFALAALASYIGYQYKLALQRQHPSDEIGGNALNNQNPAYLYNGNNLGYVNPSNRNNQNPYSEPASRSFQPFQGPGYSLN